MTIDDFIDTYKSYAEDYRKETYNMGYSTQQRDYARNKAREYEQLAEWLEELKLLRIQKSELQDVVASLQCQLESNSDDAVREFAEKLRNNSNKMYLFNIENEENSRRTRLTINYLIEKTLEEMGVE